MKRYISLLPMLLIAAIGIAQTANDTINRMVLVESTYNPIIAGAVKRNFIPEEVKPLMNKEQVIYASESVNLTHFVREAKPAPIAPMTTEKGWPGYLHLGYGNYNNLNGLAAFNWDINDTNNLALKAHADGWNGNFKLNNEKWNSHLYDMALGADYNALLGKATLNIGLHTSYHNYNYLGGGTQSSNNIGAHIGIQGIAKEHYYYHATLSYSHFGRSTHFSESVPHGENHIHSELSLGKDLYQWGMPKVLLSSDILTYGGEITGYHNYYTLGITPQWDYRYKNLHLLGGLNMDLFIGKNIHHPVQVSPECSIEYTASRIFSTRLTLDGGRDINSFAQLYALSPYWAAKEQIRPTHTFMNAYLEGNARILEGLHLHLGGGYKILSDALFETAMDSVGTTYTGITNHNAQVATIDAAVNYTHKDLVSISAKGAYHHWMLRGDRALLARAPQLKVDLDARVRIIPNLHAYTNLRIISFSNTKADTRERAIIDWSLGANYALNQRFSFFLDTHNLLNRRYSYYTGYPAQGFNVMAGAVVKF